MLPCVVRPKIHIRHFCTKPIMSLMTVLHSEKQVRSAHTGLKLCQKGDATTSIKTLYLGKNVTCDSLARKRRYEVSCQKVLTFIN